MGTARQMAHNLEEQHTLGQDQALARLNAIPSDIEKYMWLRLLLEEKPSEYYRLLTSQTERVLPFIYTPTVGEACTRYFELKQRPQEPRLRPKGLFLSLEDRGRILEKLRSWPQQNVKVIVVTDGERILGLGDLGAGGMGISEGKITLYTIAAGVDPSVCLPVCLDMGTNNKRLLNDPMTQYQGLKRERATGAEFDSFMAEFMDALSQWQPHVLVQYEDFGNTNAFRLLEKYRASHCTFNDDIQGTAAITLAAILAALRAVEFDKGNSGINRAGKQIDSDEALGSGQLLAGKQVLFLGAGEAGTGIGELIAYCVHRRTGCSMNEARKTCHFVDSKGLVCASRMPDLQHHKQAFAHDTPYCKTLLEAVRLLKPVAIIGVSTIAGSFNEEVLREMAAINHRPIIFPLSNPTTKSECTFEEAFKHTEGRVLFASGSPFDPIFVPSQSSGNASQPALAGDGILMRPAQANNAYVFPALGHAAVLARCSSISDEAFLTAAEALAAMADPKMVLREGALFPPFSKIKDTSSHVMAHVMACMVREGRGLRPEGVAVQQGPAKASDFLPHCLAHMWLGPGEKAPEAAVELSHRSSRL
uniref:Malic enzyme n=1 Tax=Dunaliella tertiolecta TaxID=3047 RepID=A0A2U8JGL4_DUNTE|nr:MME2 [Dunaliella tertiolecta]